MPRASSVLHRSTQVLLRSVRACSSLLRLAQVASQTAQVQWLKRQFLVQILGCKYGCNCRCRKRCHISKQPSSVWRRWSKLGELRRSVQIVVERSQRGVGIMTPQRPLTTSLSDPPVFSATHSYNTVAEHGERRYRGIEARRVACHQIMALLYSSWEHS
jgi:hypothetical protein